MPDRKQIPGLPASTEANDNDLLIKRNVSNGSDERITVENFRASAFSVSDVLIVSVPTDYSTVQDAINAESTKIASQQGFVEIVIEDGHRPESGIVVENGDFSHFLIVSENDATVVLDDEFPNDEDFIQGNYAVMPVVACTIDMNNRGRHGVHANQESKAFVAEGFGVNNSRGYAYEVMRRSSMIANETTVDGNLGEFDRHVHVSHASILSMRGGQVRNFANIGLYASHGSIINFRNGVVENETQSASDGILANQGARIAAFQSSVSNCGRNAYRARHGSVISCPEAQVSDISESAFHAMHNSSIACDQATVENAERGVWASECSTVDANEIQISDTAIDGVFATRGSTINCESAVIENVGEHGLFANRGSTISAMLASIDGAAANGIYAFRSSRIAAQDATLSNISGVGVWSRNVSSVDFQGGDAGNSEVRATAGSVVNSQGSTNVDSYNPSISVSEDENDSATSISSGDGRVDLGVEASVTGQISGQVTISIEVAYSADTSADTRGINFYTVPSVLNNEELVRTTRSAVARHAGGVREKITVIGTGYTPGESYNFRVEADITTDDLEVGYCKIVAVAT